MRKEIETQNVENQIGEVKLDSPKDTGMDGAASSPMITHGTAVAAPSSSLSNRLGDINRLRVSTNYTASTGVEKALLQLDVRKPGKQEFVQAHPSLDYQFDGYLIELAEEQEVYLIDPGLLPYLSAADAKPNLLVLAVNSQGVPFLWRVPMPGPEGKVDKYLRSVQLALDEARKGWRRMVWNQSSKTYDVYLPGVEMPPPTYPKQSMLELLDLAFKDRFIDSLEHPVLKRLAGKKV